MVLVNGMELAYTRAMVTAAIEGKLTMEDTVQEEFFGLHVPKTMPGVPSELLMPINTWQDKEAYKQKAKELANHFRDNFRKFNGIDPVIEKLGGPIV